RRGRPNDCSTSSSNPILEGPCAESEEKREPVGDIALELVDSLKTLDPAGRLEKRTRPGDLRTIGRCPAPLCPAPSLITSPNPTAPAPPTAAARRGRRAARYRRRCAGARVDCPRWGRRHAKAVLHSSRPTADCLVAVAPGRTHRGRRQTAYCLRARGRVRPRRSPGRGWC